jgi:hypothetical protein
VLLASTTIALAAGGVILTGAPVRSRAPQNPNVGNGVPARGASLLLPLSVPDPEGGLPWSMRIVNTTRGEVCLQVGRLQNGQLGELGLDGAFHDDGRFHPMSAAVLPTMTRIGVVAPADANTSCQLAGKAVAGRHIGLDRSAAEGAARAKPPRSVLRDIDYGILGPQAVSVTYRSGKQHLTVPVVPGTGAYLIVQRTNRRDQVGAGDESLGTYGDLTPYGSLSAITYHIDGKLCQREPVRPPWVKTRVADECQQPRWPSGPSNTRNLHRPIHVHLHTSHGLITGMDVSFRAPLAVSNASHEYALEIPHLPCHDGEAGQSYAGMSLDRNVKRGETVTFHASDPFTVFANDCAHSSATVEVMYRGVEGTGSVLVGSTTVHEPPGTRPAPIPMPRRLGRLYRRRR